MFDVLKIAAVAMRKHKTTECSFRLVRQALDISTPIIPLLLVYFAGYPWNRLLWQVRNGREILLYKAVLLASLCCGITVASLPKNEQRSPNRLLNLVTFCKVFCTLTATYFSKRPKLLHIYVQLYRKATYAALKNITRITNPRHNDHVHSVSPQTPNLRPHAVARAPGYRTLPQGPSCRPETQWLHYNAP